MYLKVIQTATFRTTEHDVIVLSPGSYSMIKNPLYGDENLNTPKWVGKSNDGTEFFIQTDLDSASDKYQLIETSKHPTVPTWLLSLLALVAMLITLYIALQ